MRRHKTNKSRWRFIKCGTMFLASMLSNVFITEAANHLKTTDFSFEKDTRGWDVINGGKISVSAIQYNDGKKSLRWDWVGGSELRMNDPAIFKKIKNNGMQYSMRWATYSSQETDHAFLYRLGDAKEMEEGKEKFRFKYLLNHRGWRTNKIRTDHEFFVDYGHNKKWGGSKVVNEFRIKAPKKGSGTIYLDRMNFMAKSPGSYSNGLQIPFKNGDHRPPATQSNNLTYYFHYIKPWPKPPKRITSAEKKAFATISKRYTDFILGTNKGDNKWVQDRINAFEKSFDKLDKAWDAYKIHQGKESVQGVGLGGCYEFKPKEAASHFIAHVLTPYAFKYRMKGDEEAKKRFLMGFDYVTNQGMGEGQSWGNLAHFYNKCGVYPTALFLMWDEMSEDQKAQGMKTLRWFSEMGELYLKEYIAKGGNNSDRFLTVNNSRLITILLMEDTPEKVRDMNAFRRWLVNATTPVGGYRGVIKPDYTVWHHQCVQSVGYAASTAHKFALIPYLMHGTIFKADDQVLESLSKVALRFYVHTKFGNVLHPAIIGALKDEDNVKHSKHGWRIFLYTGLASEEPMRSKLLGHCKWYYDLDNPQVANQMGRANASERGFIHGIGEVELLEKIRTDKSIKEEGIVDGHWNYGWASFGVHRINGRSASVAGWSQTAKNFEKTDNPEHWQYRHGFLQLLSDTSSALANGYSYGTVKKGWDYTKLGGATTRVLPLDQLPGKSLILNREKFVGGGHLKERDGIFVLKLGKEMCARLQQLTDFGYDFTAKKSYFFFGETIVCVGSDILLERDKAPVVTTLFQCYLPDRNTHPTYINNTNAISELPYTLDFKGDDTPWMLDPYGHGFYVNDGDKGIMIRRQKQTDGKKGHGEYTTAWIDHGKAPSDGQYSYAIRMGANPEIMEAFAKNPPYRIIQTDSDVHFVKYGSNQHGYVFWDAFDGGDWEGPLLSAKKSCIVMTEKVGKMKMDVSVTDPDMHLGLDYTKTSGEQRNNGVPESQISIVELVFRGRWRLKEAHKNAKVLSSNGSRTVVRFKCWNGESVNVTLVK